MSTDFYPFVASDEELEQRVNHPARIAIYDDAAAAPRVVLVNPQPIREYLDEITQLVSRYSNEQGGSIPFMVIREIVENFIHASFASPTVSILDKGATLRFSDQGPGITDKKRALEYGTTSATEQMKRYIRGVGSGLPYVQQYMNDKGGSLSIEDNIGSGTVVTLSSRPAVEAFSKTRAVDSQGMPNSLDERSRFVLDHLLEVGSAGPSDFVKAYGKSAPTWSRALNRLERAGLVKKEGRKFFLTKEGSLQKEQ